MKKPNPAKELYQRLRQLSVEELWQQEVPLFDRASQKERMERVAVVRAVGVVFSETADAPAKAMARQWLRGLLHDPEEKIRRYAMNALPKLGADRDEEASLLALLESQPSVREKTYLTKALGKVGGAATLDAARSGAIDAGIIRKAGANLARAENPGSLCWEKPLHDFEGTSIRLYCREGLEEFVVDELESIDNQKVFRAVDRLKGAVLVRPAAPFTLAEVFTPRCFSSAAFVPASATELPTTLDEIAERIASPEYRRLMEAFTIGPARYRLEFSSSGRNSKTIQTVADGVHRLRPELLNDPRLALWQIDLRKEGERWHMEITPKLRPDPRFAYRTGDVPAASHPPLAAAMARVAGNNPAETVWDPFCGSGLELIERGLLGGVAELIGTDTNPHSRKISRENLLAAGLSEIPTTLECCDFRDYTKIPQLARRAVSLVITNPPLGRRVPTTNLRQLVQEIFAAASAVLRPGGRLVLVNPLPIKPENLPLHLELRKKVDLGAFHCHLEKYTKLGLGHVSEN